MENGRGRGGGGDRFLTTLRVCCEWQVDKALGQRFANVVTLARHRLVVKRVTVGPGPLRETSSTQYAAKRVPRGIGAIAANETPGRWLTLLAVLRPRAQELKPEKKPPPPPVLTGHVSSLLPY